MSSHIRHIRILDLHKKAKTGKYNWNDLRQAARSLGISEATITSYLKDVEARLRKEGLIK